MKIWKSKELYQHPVNGDYGQLIWTKASGIYTLKVGGSRQSCPQDWASKIHAKETQEVGPGRPLIGDRTLAALIVPDELRVALEETAERLGLSVPDARREAYRRFIASN